MSARIDFRRVEDGVEITKMVTVESNIVIPDNVNGTPVVSLGAQFLKDSHGPGNRTLTIPASVVRSSEEALTSVTGLRLINYLGDFETFNGFNWSLSNDCRIMCADGFSFQFLSGYTMSFPAFDDELLTSHQRISEDVVMDRLTNPVHLTEDNRIRYEWYMRSRIMPMAEHCIAQNDINGLKSIMDTGMFKSEDIRSLLESSVRSGRTASTSTIMSFINRKHQS